MFLALWYYLQGYVMITVSGFSVERFINMATFRGIYLWNMRQEGSAMQMNVSLKGYHLLEECAEKTGCQYHIVRKCGLPALFQKYKKRKVLAFGIIFFVAMLYTLSFFVWTVEIEGNERVTEEELLMACEKMGIAAGKLKWKIDTEFATENLLETFVDISWVSVSIKGTNAVVKIVETIPQPEIIDRVTPSNLIAKKDSVIQSVTVEAGTPVVQPGDVIKKGELLIDSEVIIVVGQEEEVGREYVHARGTIIGKVWYTLEEEMPLKYIEKVYTGEEKRDKSILIGDVVFNMIQPNMGDSTYDRQNIARKEFSIGDFKLPIVYIEENYQVYKTVEKERTEEQAKTELENKLKSKIEEMVEGEIEDINIVYNIQQNVVSAIATVTALEEISEEQSREQMITYDKEEEF